MNLRRLIPIRRWRELEPAVSVVRLEGVIGRVGPMRAGLSLERIERVIERAFLPKALKAVALSVNSPGGSPVQSALIAGRIRALAEEKEIPVFAFAEDVAASGGYWLAAAADEIFAHENSILGSIGVVSAGFGFPDLLERIGVERRLHTSGERKAMLDPFRPEQGEDVARLEELQFGIHESFKAYIRARRGDKLKAPEDRMFNGDVWSGREALALGLIDGIGDLRSVMRQRFGERVRLRPIQAERGLLRRRLGFGGSGGLGDVADHWGTDKWANAGAGLIAALEEDAQWRRFGL